MTPTTKTWPDYDRSMIRKPFYSIRMLFWPLWPYPQAFESVVFMTKNWWYLWNSKVALFLYCCSLQWQYKYWDLSSVTECTMSPQPTTIAINTQRTIAAAALRNEIHTIFTTSSNKNNNKQLWKPPKLLRKSRKIFSSGEVWDYIQNSTLIILNNCLGC